MLKLPKIPPNAVKAAYILVFVFAFSFQGYSQAKDPKLDHEKMPHALKIVQIPNYGKNTRELINDIEFMCGDNKILLEISPEIADILVVLDNKIAAFSDTLTTIQLDKLDKEERELALINQRVVQWKTSIQEINSDGLQYDSALLEMTQVWELTLDSMQSAVKKGTAIENPNDLESVMVHFISELENSKNILATYLDSVQLLQTEITIAENKIGNISNIIESNKNKLNQSIWNADSPKLWEMHRDTTETSKLNRFVEFVAYDFNIIHAFVKNKPLLPYYIIIYLLFIFAALVYLKSKAQDLYIDYKEEFFEAEIALKYPLATALIIAWFTSMILSSFPKELNHMISFIMLVPLSIMLKKLNKQWKWDTLAIFSFSYLLFFLIKGFDYSYLAQRIFLLTLNSLLLAAFLYLKTNKESIKLENPFWYGMLPFAINLFIIISIAALIANILGSVQMALLLCFIMLGTILTIQTLRVAIRLVQNFVFLILMGPLMQYSNILKEDGIFILKKLDKLFRLLGFVTLLSIELSLFNALTETIEVLKSIINYKLTVGEISLSLGNILAFYITIQISIWLSSLIRYVLEKEVFPRTILKQGLPNTILLMIKFTFILLGILLAFSAAGIEIDKIAIVMGALGVGIGFGLQNIISNFISGIILAIERPISIGDLVDIPDVSGVVKDIGIRASTIRTWDGSDVIVPNGELIANKVTNWTFYDRLRRIKVDVRVPFDTNMEAVSKLLLDTADTIPEVMKKPKAYLNFIGIGNSAMEITLYCWTNDSDKVFSYGTNIRKAIYKALNEAGYETPLPKQELNVNSD